MEERVYIISLFDYYGKLLTNKQQEVFIDYYFNNLTMEEISDNNSISKNAVSKQLIIIKDKLYYYESVLKLYYNNKKIHELIKDNNTIKLIENYI